MKIAFLMQGPAGPHVLWSEVGRRLSEAGADVDFQFPDVSLNDLSRVHVIREPAELADLDLDPGPLFVQRYHPPDRLDYKMYCIGERVCGVRRVWPARTYEEKLGEAFEPDEELCRIARACARAIGAD